MASVVRNVRDLDGPVTAFAINEAVMKAVAVVCRDDDDAEIECIGPGDEYFLAPYAIVPKVTRKRQKDGTMAVVNTVYHVVFTGYKVRRPHYEACKMLKASPYLAGSLNDAQGYIRVPQQKWTFFLKYVSSGECEQLVDFAVKESCRIMDIDAPERATFRALVDAKVQAMVEGTRAALVSTAPMDEVSSHPFHPDGSITNEEKAAFEAALTAQNEQKRVHAEEAAEAKRQRIDQDRLTRYLPTYDECKQIRVAEDDPNTQCRYVFSTNLDLEPHPNFACPYDRKDGPFCSMCSKMMLLAAARATPNS